MRRAANQRSLGVRALFLRGFARLARLLDDLFHDRRRRLLVMREMRLERSPPGRLRAQVRRILQYFRHRYQRLDDLALTFAIHPEHLAAPRVEVADHVAHRFFGTAHLQRHDRFENDRAGFFKRRLQAHRGCDLKRHVRRVDVVIAALEHRHLDIDYRVAGEITLDQRVAHALLHRRDELARNRAADDFILEFKAAAAHQRLDAQPAITILAAAAGLALVLALGFGAALDGFLVGDFGRLKFNFYIKYPLELLDRNLDMHLARAGKNDVMGLRVAMRLQGAIRHDQSLQRLRGLLLVAFGFGTNRKGDDGGW